MEGEGGRLRLHWRITSRLTGLQHTSPSPTLFVNGVCCSLSYPKLWSDPTYEGIVMRIGRKTLRLTSLARPSPSTDLLTSSFEFLRISNDLACRQPAGLNLVSPSRGRHCPMKRIRQGLAPTSLSLALRLPNQPKRTPIVRYCIHHLSFGLKKPLSSPNTSTGLREGKSKMEAGGPQVATSDPCLPCPPTSVSLFSAPCTPIPSTFCTSPLHLLLFASLQLSSPMAMQ